MADSTQTTIRDRISSVMDKITRSTERANAALRTTQALTRYAAKQSGGFDAAAAEARGAAAQVEQFNQKQQQSQEGSRGILDKWKKIKEGIQAARGILGGMQKVLALADTMATTSARLDLMNDGLQTTEELQSQIMGSANRARTSYLGTADAIAKMGLMAGDAFGGNKELIAFTELVNKQFGIAGTSAAGIDTAMSRLTQTMASGVLRSEEFNDIFKQAPNIIETIAKHLNVSVATLREMAASGEITGEMVKNAMLASADEINAKFEAMPMTFSQLGTLAANALLQAFDPAIQAIGQGAQWIYNNWSTIGPIFWGIAAATGAYLTISAAQAAWTAINTAGTVAYSLALMAKAAAMGVVAIATGNVTLAQQALNMAMLASPIGWIALAIGILVALIYRWVQAVGGIKIAWMIFCDVVLTAWDSLKIGFTQGVYNVLNWLDRMSLSFKTTGVSIANFMGDMKVNVLTILQNMVNGAIGMINGFIGELNKIPGVSIELIDQVTFGTTAQLENEAAKQARASELAAYQNQINSKAAGRDAELKQMEANAWQSERARKMEIAAAKAGKAASAAEGAMDWSTPANGGTLNRVNEVGAIKNEVNIADEDLKFLRDVAEMRFIQNFVTLTPTVAMNASISERVDVGSVVGEIERRLEEEFSAAAEGVYA